MTHIGSLERSFDGLDVRVLRHDTESHHENLNHKQGMHPWGRSSTIQTSKIVESGGMAKVLKKDHKSKTGFVVVEDDRLMEKTLSALV